MVSCWVSFFLFASFSFFLSIPPDTVLILWPRTPLQKERVEPNNKNRPGYILYLFVRGTGAVVREGTFKIQYPPNPLLPLVPSLPRCPSLPRLTTQCSG